MIGSTLKYQDASLVTHSNKSRINAVTSGNGKSGVERSRHPMPDIQIHPKFRLDDGKVFTIGSCFARNIEAALVRQGVDCITSHFKLPGEMYELTGHGARNGALNAYTPHSMNDLVRLPSNPTGGILQTGDDEFVDMMMSGLKPQTEAVTKETRAGLVDLYESMADASTVVITLGYTESWFDTEDGIFVNRSPGASRKTLRHGDRYNFLNASAAQVSEALESIARRVHEVTGGRAKLIITTSPVPLHATFTGRDVICANLYSKCTLLSSAVLLASRHDWIDYYPSYELVTGSQKDVAWEDDGIHVKQSLVDQVIGKFTEAYL